MRNFHNWIKSVLIQKYTDKIRAAGIKDISIMDFGCVKGGDVQKWKKNEIANCVAVDISKKSLEEYRDNRWGTIQGRRFSLMLIEEDGRVPAKEILKYVDEKMYFDLISSQFAFHYMFDSEESVRNALETISTKLCKGGYFICTIPDACVIVKRLRELGRKAANSRDIFIGNDYYSIKCSTTEFPKKKSFGLEYGFFLDEGAVGQRVVDKDKVVYVPEYLIEMRALQKLAREYHLELEETANFLNFFENNKSIPKYADLLGVLRFKLEAGETIDPQLWEISHLYRIAVFKKTAGVDMKSISREFPGSASAKVHFKNY
jgi:mRNA (guanine-N7-)-methyltransferase